MDEDRERQLAELKSEIDKTIDRMWEMTRPSWQFKLGPIYVQRQFSSLVPTSVYVFLISFLGVGGASLILLTRGRAADLGIALVVGSLFSITSFVSAAWVLTVESERDRWRQVFGPDYKQWIDELRHRRDHLISRLETLEADGDDNPPGQG